MRDGLEWTDFNVTEAIEHYHNLSWSSHDGAIPTYWLGMWCMSPCRILCSATPFPHFGFQHNVIFPYPFFVCQNCHAIFCRCSSTMHRSMVLFISMAAPMPADTHSSIVFSDVCSRQITITHTHTHRRRTFKRALSYGLCIHNNKQFRERWTLPASLWQICESKGKLLVRVSEFESKGKRAEEVWFFFSLHVFCIVEFCISYSSCHMRDIQRFKG